MQETVAAQGVETKTDAKTRVFISYSRKDMAFADRLEAALKARGFEVLIDREEIYAFEDWWKRIQALIGQSDTVVFVLSPDAVASREALREIDYAASLNKRFAPIVCRPVEDNAVPESLRRLNFIFFDEPERFDTSVDELAEALHTDIGWIRQHTEYGEAERRWLAAGRPNGLLLQSPTLDLAEFWLVSRPRNAPEPTEQVRSYVLASRKRARTSQRVWRLVLASTFTFMAATILGLVGWINQTYIAEQWRWWTNDRWFVAANIWPYVLAPASERTLKPRDSFRECIPRRQTVDYCPDMVVVSAGSFIMGSPENEPGRHLNEESPQHPVTIAQAFAVSKFELTFAEWDACVAGGGCNAYKPNDQQWGRGEQPAIYVSWEDAHQYTAWLSKMTGKSYRLLSEAEYEYATRAGTTTMYPWGNDIKLDGMAMADCEHCGSPWDAKQPAPVGSFPPNAFGLYDMLGNVGQWVEDCMHLSYEIQTPQGKLDAPKDGSAWLQGGDCRNRVVRGNSWTYPPASMRSASRSWLPTDARYFDIGFRVARTLLAP